MTAVFLTVLEIALGLTPLLAVLLLLHPLLAKRYTARFRYLIWLVLAVRLLVPLNITWQHGLHLDLTRIPSALTGEANAEQAGERVVFAGERQLSGEADAVVPQYLPNLGKGNTGEESPVIRSLAVAWLAGGVLFAGYHLTAYWSTKRQIGRWSTPVRSRELAGMLERVKNRMGLRRRVGLYRSDRVSGPMVIGFFRPRIVLPSGVFEEEQLEGILHHELSHVRRRDLWFKLLLLLANTLYWFHPLVHRMGRKAEMDMETACDSDVLYHADKRARRQYGFAILAVAEGQKRFRTPLTTGFIGGKKEMLQRFQDIMEGTGKRRGAGLLVLILALTFLCSALVGCDLGPSETAGTGPVQEPQSVALDGAAPAGEIVGVAVTPKANDEEDGVPAAGHQDIQAMEKLFQSDLEENMDKAQQTQEELEAVSEGIGWDEGPYVGGSMVWPVESYYTITSPYGWRFGGSDFHTGMDISGSDIYGSPVSAAQSGTVRFVNREYTAGMGYGMYLIVDHGGGIGTLYAQCSEILVKEGDKVSQGQTIARVGDTGFSSGPHLHFEVRENGTHVNPLPYIATQVDKPMIWPVEGYVSAGMNAYPGHTGMDIAGEQGDPILAAADGTVLMVKEGYTGYGNYVIIDHGDGVQTLYAQLHTIDVERGDTVGQGQQIGTRGRSGNATGNHLHFEVRINGTVVDPVEYLQ